MKSLLIRVTLGLDERDILPDELEHIEQWYQHGMLKKESGIYKLHSKYRAGRVMLTHNGSGAYIQVLALSVRDLFVDSSNLDGVQTGDLVIAKRILGNNRGAPSATIALVVGQEASYSVGYIKTNLGVKTLIDIKTSHPCGVQISSQNLSLYEEYTLFKISNQDGQIVENLGNLTDPLVDEKIVLAMYNRDDKFDDDVLDLVRDFSDNISLDEYKHRVDLRDLPFCTIDPVSAKDFDDAICFVPSTSTLYVAIADVGAYVAPFGALDAEAAKRGFSIYFPHKSIPMLPRILSETLCSLQPQVDRLAYVFEIKLDGASVVSSKLYEAVIHSKRRFTYEQIDAFFQGKLKLCEEGDKDIFGYISPLKRLTEQLRQKRLDIGFDFHSLEIEMKLDDSAQIQSVELAEQTPSHSLIEECMLLANKEAASMFERGIFRIHESPTESSLQNLYEELSTIGIVVDFKESLQETIESIQSEAQARDLSAEVDELIIRAQMRARYAPENSGHFGLGFDKYTHFTSPIRRYSDLIVHRLLKAIQADSTTQSSYLLRNIDALCFAVSDKEREIADIEFRFFDRKYARWALKYRGKSIQARIIATTPQVIAQVQNPLFGAKMVVYGGDNLALFDDIVAKIESVDLATTKITSTYLDRVN